MVDKILKEVFELEVGRDSESGLPRWQVIRLNGKLHSPADDRPAQIIFDEQGHPTEMGWFHENRYHRLSGPALVKLNPDTGVCTYEEHRSFGAMHRSQAEPALLLRDAETNEIVEAHYYVRGREVDPRKHTRLDPSP